MEVETSLDAHRLYRMRRMQYVSFADVRVWSTAAVCRRTYLMSCSGKTFSHHSFYSSIFSICKSLSIFYCVLLALFYSIFTLLYQTHLSSMLRMNLPRIIYLHSYTTCSCTSTHDIYQGSCSIHLTFPFIHPFVFHRSVLVSYLSVS
jgi:hypothetical protein